MRLSVSFVIASGALAVAACAGDAGRSLPTSLHPMFQTVWDDTNYNSCAATVAWLASAPQHFDSIAVTFLDAQHLPRATCGDLPFSGDSAFVRVAWNPMGHNTSPSVWVRKYRSANSAFHDDWRVVFNRVLDSLEVKDTTFGLALGQGADAASMRLYLISNAFDSTNDAGQRDDTTATRSFEQNCDEACTEMWRHIDAPQLDSVRIVGDTSVQVFWRNHNWGRSYDTTLLHRDGAVVGKTADTMHAFLDHPVGVGVHAYTVRHVAPSSPWYDLPPHYSQFATQLSITVGPPAPTGLGCAGNFTATIDCQWTVTTQTDSTLVYRDAAVKARLAPGVATWTDGAVTRGSSYNYQVAHVRGAFVGALTAAVPTVANPVPPSALACTKTGISTSRCTWTNGEAAESTAVQRQEAGTWTGIAILVPGTALYNDASLHGGVTYTYRVDHRHGADVSAFSASVAVTIDSPPPPTNFVCRGNFNPWMDCSWINTDATDSVYVYRNNTLRARIAPGITGWTDDPVTADVTYTYNIRHVDRTVQGPLSATISETATAEAPGNLSCGGTSVSTVTCVWIPTEPGDTAIVEDSTAGRFGNWTYGGKVPPQDPALGQFFDNGLTQGVTYWYRVYYRKGSRKGRYSNLDPAVPDSIAEPYRPIGH